MPQFVIHKHDASTLHYDFRLEVDGALKSWAVPKGPSTNPRERRMATPTEDHPLEYADFEGVIPPEDYGAGAVLVWDTGSFRNLTTDGDDEVPMGKALEDGHATIWLDGHKLRGGYALTRIRSGKNEAWLLVKAKDDEAGARRDPVSTEPDSALTKRSLDDVRADGDVEA